MESDDKIKRGYINKLVEQTNRSARNVKKAVLKPIITLHTPVLRSPGSTIPFLIILICSIAGLGWSVIGLKGGSARRDTGKFLGKTNVFFEKKNCSNQNIELSQLVETNVPHINLKADKKRNFVMGTTSSAAFVTNMPLQ